MKKLSYIAIIAIWGLVLAFVIASWVSAPSEDEYKAVMSYADIIDNYSKGKPIEPEQIEDLGNNTKFTIVTANILVELQKIESPINDSYNIILAGQEINSLLNAEASARNKNILPQFIADVTATNAKRETLYEKYITEMKSIPTKGLIFPVESVVKSIKEEKPKREGYSNDLIAVATYTSYLIDFINSRRNGNYFTSDGQQIIFQSLEDQKYYNTLVAQMQSHKRNVDKYRAELKSDIEAVVNGIRNSKKKRNG